jgi:drug/metabolite transporter (DMT)-like permease
MSQQNLWLLVAFLGYSLYSATIGKVTSYAHPSIVLAVYMSTGAVIAWGYVFTHGQARVVTQLPVGQLLAMMAIGLLIFISDLAYTRLFILKIPYPVIYGFIAWVAVGTMFFLSVFNLEWPNWKQMVGVAICCYGAYVINTEKFGLP